MPKIEDLSPKFDIPTAEKELEMAMQESIMGQRSGGLSLFSDSFKRGYGNAVFGSDSNGIWLGAADYANAPFKVSMAGALTSTTATITGMGQNFVSTIAWTATDLDTATWASGTIKTNDGTSYAIDAGNTGDITSDVYIYLDPNTSTTVLQQSTTATDAAGESIILIAIVQKGAVGSECIIDVVGGSGTTIDGDKITTGTIVADRISVSNLAAINADLGTITAGDISGITIAIGTANAIFKADSNGIYLGNATFASAPFKVDMDGAVNASNLVITGGTININDNFTVSASGSVVANMYSLNSGNIINHPSGMIFKNTYGTLFYNSANSAMIALLNVDAANKLNLANTVGQTSITAGNVEGFLMNTAGWVSMSYGASISGGLNIPTGNITMNTGYLSSSTSNISIASGKNLVFAGTQGSINCGTINCDAIDMNDNHLTNVNNMSCTSISLNNGQNEGSIQNIDTLLGYNDLRLKVPSGATGSTNRVMFVDSNNNETASIRANDTGKFFSDNSYINLNGTDKLAIVPTKDGHKALYCAEAPEVWFFDFCKSKEDVDPLFLEVTEGEKKFIKVEGGGYQVWRRRKGHGNKRFESKTAKQFEANERFLSTPKEND